MKGRRSLRPRLMGALVGVALFTVGVVGAVYYLFLGDYVLDRQEAALLHEATATAEQIENVVELLPGGGMGSHMLSMFLRTRVEALPKGAGIVLFGKDEILAGAGRIPVRREPLERLRDMAEQVARGHPGSGRLLAELGGPNDATTVLFASVPLRLPDGTEGLAVVTLPRSEALSLRTDVFKVLGISAAVAAAVAALVGWGLAAWLARPLRRLSAAAHDLAQGRYDEGIAGSYPGELQELADSLEHSRKEIKHSQDSLRAFVATAAHELRTPLTSIQGFSQALLDGTASDEELRQRAAVAINKESLRLQRLIDALLTLSRYDSREFRPRLAPVALEALIREEVSALVQAGWTEAQRVAVSVEKGLQVVTDGDMLRQALANLLRNAVQYGQQGKDGPVGVEAYSSADRIFIEVWNQGPPPPWPERGRLFERFYRGSASKQGEGLGLGLALTKEICRLLGGAVELLDRETETRFRITLPLVGTGVSAPGCPWEAVCYHTSRVGER